MRSGGKRGNVCFHILRRAAPRAIMIIGWRKQSIFRLFSLPNDKFASE